jgi:3'-phosphoadenosine 5'-phosphosulfate sulfotransferase (PAPS reductase)/FAD synthetase
MIFYDWSGGMESSAMLALDRERIRETGAIVRLADTGKYVPEFYESKDQIEQILDLNIVTVPRRIDFDTYLFERGGMIRKGTNDCSRKMKRSNLSRHMRSFEKPYEVNLGYNADEQERADEWIARNERQWLRWGFPLIRDGVDRAASWDVCRKAGFTVLVRVYERDGRMDCFMCGNQTPAQAIKVIKHHPAQAEEWKQMEARKGHSFMPIPLVVLQENYETGGPLFANLPPVKCACFGGNDDATGEEEEA